MKKRSLVLAAVIAASVASSHAATLATTVAADTYLRNDASPGPQNGDPDNEFLIGSNGSQRLNGLVRFDVTQIIADVNTFGGGDFANLIIHSATIQLFERRNNAGASYSGTVAASVYSYGYSFNPSVSVWADPDGDGNNATGDTTPGGSIGASHGSALLNWTNTAADNDSTTVTLGTASLLAMIGTVPVGGSANDLNFLIRGDVTDAASPDSEFRSIKSDLTAGNRALLTVNYSIVPEPSAALLGGLGLLALLRRRR